MRTARLLAVAAVLLLSGPGILAQQLRLGKNPFTVEKSAVLELQSDNQGFLLPRIADTALINVIVPPDGMMIYYLPLKQVLIKSNGYWHGLLTTIDTSGITNFSQKVRSLFSGVAPVTYNSATGQIGITQASASTNGYLSSVDWNTFNNKAAAFTKGNLTETGSGILTITGGTNAVLGGGTTIQVKQAGAAQNGFLSSADWNTFNNKASATNTWALGGNTVTTVKTLGTIDNNDLPFITNNTEKMRLSAAGNLGIGASSFDGTNPEKLLVSAGTTSSVNAIVGRGSINNYLQLNIQNQSSGASASSDVVATADNGNETTNYVDLGINSSANTNNYFGGANDAYLYNLGQNFLLGTGTAGKNLVFMTGGGTQSTNERMRIDGSGNVGIGTTTPSTKLHVSGTNPLTLNGVQTGTSTSSDSLLTITNGLVRKLPMSTFATPVITGNLTETGSSILTITGGANAVIGSGTSIQVKQASSSQNGFLSSADWTTFNNKLSTIDTTNISNFYLKVRAEHTAGSGIGYNNTTGVISNSGVLSVNGNTGALTMDTGYISSFSVKTRSLFSGTAPVTYNNATGQIGITLASATTNGYLSSADWNSFNSKAAAFTTGNLTETGSGILTITGGTNAVNGSGTSIQVKQAGAAQNGFLSSTDWTTFNNKLSTIDTTNISNFYLKVRAEHTAGPGISYNNSTGVISNSGVLSVNGNTGALTMDTGYIANFYQKTRSLFSVTAPVTYSNGLIGITQASATTSGYLSSVDWNSFNSKASAAISSLNGLTTATQTFATGNGGSDFNIVSSSSTHTFNIPDASASARGLITTGAQTIAGAKTFSSAPLFSSLTVGSVPFIGTGGVLTQDNPNLFWDNTNNRLGIGTNTPASDFSLFQGSGASTSRGFRFTGNAISGANNGTGFAISLGYNVPGNKQLWLGDADYLGNSAGTFVRYSSSGGTTTFDAVAGDNSVRRPISIGVGGDPLSAVILGNDGSETAPGSYVWANGNMAIGNSFRSSSAPTDGLVVSGNTGIGTTTFNATYPEKLLVDAGSSGTVNAIVGKGNLNNYLQLNIQNANSGGSASSDVVATADNGSETTNYIDMGINSSGNTSGSMGNANDAYLYNIGQNLLIGTGTAAKVLAFLTGGTAQGTNERMRIDGSGNVGIATTSPAAKFDANGTVKLGAKGTAEKNVISFVVSFASSTSVPGGSMNILAGSFSAGSLDQSVTIPASNTPTTTQGSVSVSTDQDLPANVSIAWARVSATSTVKIRFLNASTSSQTIPSGLKLFITVTEF